ncbi:hypothetical protein PLESTM_000530700 [Pleodorina starrii]|nr:hypothetical protein PLESTM_000530700 [Pleodorina starrii]
MASTARREEESLRSGFPNRVPPQNTKKRAVSSKYDVHKVKVWLGDKRDHYYILSRFLISRSLTITKIPSTKAIKIALELKKHLVDHDKLSVSQEELEETLFSLMRAKGYGQAYIDCYRTVSEFYQLRQPLVILLCGAPCTGKSTIAQQLAARLNMPNVMQTDVICELMRRGTGGALPPQPPWARSPDPIELLARGQPAPTLAGAAGPVAQHGADPRVDEQHHPQHTGPLAGRSAGVAGSAGGAAEPAVGNGGAGGGAAAAAEDGDSSIAASLPRSADGDGLRLAACGSGSVGGCLGAGIGASPEDAWLLSEFQSECRLVRRALQGDFNKALTDGKPLIVEGVHLDPGQLLRELQELGIVILPVEPAPATPQSGSNRSEQRSPVLQLELAGSGAGAGLELGTGAGNAEPDQEPEPEPEPGSGGGCGGFELLGGGADEVMTPEARSGSGSGSGSGGGGRCVSPLPQPDFSPGLSCGSGAAAVRLQAADAAQSAEAPMAEAAGEAAAKPLEQQQHARTCQKHVSWGRAAEQVVQGGGGAVTAGGSGGVAEAEGDPDVDVGADLGDGEGEGEGEGDEEGSGQGKDRGCGEGGTRRRRRRLPRAGALLEPSTAAAAAVKQQRHRTPSPPPSGLPHGALSEHQTPQSPRDITAAPATGQRRSQAGAGDAGASPGNRPMGRPSGSPKPRPGFANHNEASQTAAGVVLPPAADPLDSDVCPDAHVRGPLGALRPAPGAAVAALEAAGWEAELSEAEAAEEEADVGLEERDISGRCRWGGGASSHGGSSPRASANNVDDAASDVNYGDADTDGAVSGSASPLRGASPPPHAQPAAAVAVVPSPPPHDGPAAPIRRAKSHPVISSTGLDDGEGEGEQEEDEEAVSAGEAGGPVGAAAGAVGSAFRAAAQVALVGGLPDAPAAASASGGAPGGFVSGAAVTAARMLDRARSHQMLLSGAAGGRLAGGGGGGAHHLHTVQQQLQLQQQPGATPSGFPRNGSLSTMDLLSVRNSLAGILRMGSVAHGSRLTPSPRLNRPTMPGRAGSSCGASPSSGGSPSTLASVFSQAAAAREREHLHAGAQAPPPNPQQQQQQQQRQQHQFTTVSWEAHSRNTQQQPPQRQRDAPPREPQLQQADSGIGGGVGGAAGGVGAPGDDALVGAEAAGGVSGQAADGGRGWGCITPLQGRHPSSWRTAPAAAVGLGSASAADLGAVPADLVSTPRAPQGLQRPQQPERQQEDQVTPAARAPAGGGPAAAGVNGGGGGGAALPPLFVPIVLRMSEADHRLALEDNTAVYDRGGGGGGGSDSARGTASGDGHPLMQLQLQQPGKGGVAAPSDPGCPEPGPEAVLRRAQALQQYLCSFESQGMPVVNVKYGNFHEALDVLHEYVLMCIQAAMEQLCESRACECDTVAAAVAPT